MLEKFMFFVLEFVAMFYFFVMLMLSGGIIWYAIDAHRLSKKAADPVTRRVNALYEINRRMKVIKEENDNKE